MYCMHVHVCTEHTVYTHTCLHSFVRATGISARSQGTGTNCMSYAVSVCVIPSKYRACVRQLHVLSRCLNDTNCLAGSIVELRKEHYMAGNTYVLLPQTPLQSSRSYAQGSIALRGCYHHTGSNTTLKRARGACV